MCRFGSEAYWLERPVGLISKATGQRLTPDYITNPPQAAVLCQYMQQHPEAACTIPAPDGGSQHPGMHLRTFECEGKYQKLGRVKQRTPGSEMSLMLKDVGCGRTGGELLRSHVATCWW